MQNRQDFWTKIIFVVALIFSWLSVIFFLNYRIWGVFTIGFWIITLIVLFIRKSRLKWLLIGLSAWIILPLYGFLSGTKDYFSGNAALEFSGMPSIESLNLDRDYRTWNQSTGCVSHGYDSFISLPNNIAVKFWTNFLGYQKDVYAGFYPDKNEAFKLIDSLGQKASFVKEKKKYRFKFSGGDCQMNIENKGVELTLNNCDSARVAIIKDQLVILRFNHEDGFSETYLADKETGNIFATY